MWGVEVSALPATPITPTFLAQIALSNVGWLSLEAEEGPLCGVLKSPTLLGTPISPAFRRVSAACRGRPLRNVGRSIGNGGATPTEEE